MCSKKQEKNKFELCFAVIFMYIYIGREKIVKMLFALFPDLDFGMDKKDDALSGKLVTHGAVSVRRSIVQDLFIY